MDAARPDASGFIARLRARLRAVLLIEGLARLVAYAIAACAGAILVDYVFRLPVPLRLVLLVGIVALLVTTVRRRLSRPLRRGMDDRTLANLIERRLPALDGRLLSQIDGIELPEHDQRTLAETLSPSAARVLVPAPALPWYAAAACVALLLVVGAVTIAPQIVASGASRLFLPFGGAAWQRSDTLEGRLENPVVPADEPLVVEIRRTRGDAAAVHLSWSDTRHPGIGDGRTLEGLEGPWRNPLSLPPGTWRIEAASGDADALALSGRVVARPRLAEITATLTPPAYAESEAQKLSTLACTALPGSTLAFHVRFDMEEDRRAEHVVLTLAGQPVAVEREPRGLSGTIAIKTGGELALDVLDQDSIGAKPAPRFALTLAEDRVPVVALDGARNNEAVTPRAVLGLTVDARDDYGLASLELDTQVGAAAKDGEATEPAAGERTTLVQFPGVSGFATTRPAKVTVGDLAKIGERLLLTGVAKDRNDVSGPGVGTSEALQLRVVSEEDLRRELDRLIADARERVTQARDEIGRGLAKKDQAGQLAGASRNAGLAARKASETIGQIVRRWRDNQLPADQAEPIAKAGTLIDEQADPKLAEVPSAGEQAAPTAEAADKALGEAERLLAGLIQDGDVGRELASVLARERSLHDEAKAFTREYLAKPLDDAGKQRQESLASRQKDLSDQMKGIERKVLESKAKQMASAQDLVRSDQPADALAQAGQQLGSKDQRPQGVQRQESAIASMEKLLALLQGSDAAKSLADQVGALARDQEQLTQELEQGTPPGELKERQKDVAKRTDELLKKMQADNKQADAAKDVQGANQSQGAAADSMSKGDRGGAARESSSAAAQLREAQRKLGGDQQQQDKPKDKRTADIIALLKELRGLQIKVVDDATALDKRVGEQALDFAAKRDVGKLGEQQGDIVLRLDEEAVKEMEGHAIVLAALARVKAAMAKAQTRFEEPALGEKGVRLAKTALYELNRLIDVAEHLPQSEDDGTQGNGGGGQQAKFPPQAELGLLRAMEEELAAHTAANAPLDLAAAQQTASDLLAVVGQQTRPGSRPAVLIERAQRAMASAHYLLKNDDRGLTTRHEEEAAVAALTRLLQEAKRSGGGNDQQNPQPPQDPQNGQPPPSQPNQGAAGASSGGNAAKGGAAKGESHPAGLAETGDPQAALMHLPPEARERLRQARELNLPPAAMQLYQRYLEELEGKP